MEWQKTFGGSEIDEAYSIQEADDEGFIIGGRTYSINGDVTGNHGGSLNQDYWLVKINDAGALLWERALGGNSGDNIYSIKTLNDGGYVLAGDSYSSDGDIPGNHGYTDAWVLRLNSVGEVLWKKSMGGNAYDGSYHVEPTADGGYIVGARASSYDGDVTGQHGAGDYWLIKLSPEMVGVENNAYLNQAKYLEVFPNPSTDEVFIKLSSEEPSINVQISNLLGQQLSQQTIPNGGSLDISKLPNGIYCVLVTTPTGKVFSSKFTKQE